jgi:hypothetical protein
MISGNPVVDVCNQYRTARLNVRYLESKLRRLRRKNFWLEFLIALSASSVAAKAWYFQGDIGGCVWKILTGVTALLAIAKPLLKLSEKIRDSEDRLAGYKTLDFFLERILITIREKKAYDKEVQKQFSVALDMKQKLIEKDKGPEPNEKLLNECYEKVLKELPEDSFYIPKER